VGHRDRRFDCHLLAEFDLLIHLPNDLDGCRRHAERLKGQGSSGAWVLGGGWRDDWFPDRTPKARDLDAVFGLDTPVLLRRWDMHACWWVDGPCCLCREHCGRLSHLSRLHGHRQPVSNIDIATRAYGSGTVQTEGHAQPLLPLIRCSTKALELAGLLDPSVASPKGGQIVRDGGGKAVGLLYDAAQDLVVRAIPPLTLEVRDVINRPSLVCSQF
jgi:hypothetical protein